MIKHQKKKIHKKKKLFHVVDSTNNNKRINKVGRYDTLQAGRNTKEAEQRINSLLCYCFKERTVHLALQIISAFAYITQTTCYIAAVQKDTRNICH